MHETDDTTHHTRKKNIGTLILVGVCLVATIGAITFYVKYQKAQDGGQAAQKKMLASIGAVVALPKEQPTIVAVADKEKLSNKALASRVENKDLLLIFGSTKRIIVYRPATSKVIDMLTFAAQNEVSSGTQPAAAVKP